MGRKELADVVFKVGKDAHPIYAHRLLLAAHSPVFAAMCYPLAFDKSVASERKGQESMPSGDDEKTSERKQSKEAASVRVCTARYEMKCSTEPMEVSTNHARKKRAHWRAAHAHTSARRHSSALAHAPLIPCVRMSRPSAGISRTRAILRRVFLRVLAKCH